MIHALLAAAVVTSSAPPFAPPIDTPLRYETIERRPAAGAAPEQRFTMIEEARFARDGAGYRLTVRMISVHADAPALIAAMFEAGMAPFLDIPVTVAVSARGEPGAMIGAEAAWARLVAGLEALKAGDGTEPPQRRALIAAVVAAISATPPADREAKLRDAADAILGLRLPALAIGGSMPLAATLAAPSGPVKADGVVTRRPDGDGTHIYRSATDADAPSLHLHGEEEVILSASSGLMLSDTRRTLIGGGIDAGIDAGAGGALMLTSETTTRLLF